jgi:hypothetical protein
MSNDEYFQRISAEILGSIRLPTRKSPQLAEKLKKGRFPIRPFWTADWRPPTPCYSRLTL